MQNDPFRDPEYRQQPVIINNDGMGAGSVASAVLFAFLAIGGMIYMYNTSETRVAGDPAATSRPTATAPAPLPPRPAPSTTGSAPAQ